MSFLEFWQQEHYKILVDVVTTATGFLTALLINSLVNDWRDRRTYRSLMRAIQAEANSNLVVYKESFLAYYEEGLVLREFSLSAVSQGLTNPLFVKNATAAELEQLGEYVRSLSLANVYRAKIEVLRIRDDHLQRSSAWEPGLVEALGAHLPTCKRSMEDVTGSAPRIGSAHA